MIVAVFPFRSQAGDDQEWFLELSRGDDRAHAGMTNDRRRARDELSVASGTNELFPGDVRRRSLRGADLSEDILASAFMGPVIDPGNQSIKG